MPIDRGDILARHKQPPGFLGGKVLSDVSIPVPKKVRLWMFQKIRLPEKKEAFKRLLQRRYKLGFKKEQNRSCVAL